MQPFWCIDAGAMILVQPRAVHAEGAKLRYTTLQSSVLTAASICTHCDWRMGRGKAGRDELNQNRWQAADLHRINKLRRGRRMEAITIEETLNAPIDRVWRAWTDPEQLCPWFALRADVVPKRGGPYELFWDLAHPQLQSTLGCRITFIEPQRWLGFTWRGPSIYDDLMNENAVPPPPPTHVAVSFATNGAQTTVRLSHTGWLEGERWAEARAWHVRAWQAVFQNLAAFVEGRKLPVDWLAPVAQS